MPDITDGFGDGGGRPKVLAISGSLRRRSYNTALLRIAAAEARGFLDVEVFSLAGIPLYDEDLLRDGTPGPVATLKERIKEADGVLFAVPEYNYSFSGVLKNAVDWVSRPVAECPLDGKPCALVGASTSRAGTVRAQAAMRTVLASMNAYVLPKPEVFVADARQRFGPDGQLLDDVAQQFLAELLKGFADWIGRLVRFPVPDASLP